MRRWAKVTLKTLAILAIIAGSIAIGPFWPALGALALVVIVIVSLVVDHLIDKGKWPPFGGPWPRRRRDDENAVPQLTEGDHEDPEERKKPQAR